MLRTNAALAACVNEYDDAQACARNDDAPSVTLASVLEAVEIESTKYRRIAANTQKTYRAARRSFCAWAQAHGVCAVSQITIEALNAYVDALTVEGKTASTIALFAGHIRRLAVDAAGLGRADAIDGRILKWAPRDEHQKRPHIRQALTAEEVQRVLSTAERHGLRALAVVHLALCGLRTCEVARITVGDVDLEGGRVRILGKGRAEPEWINVPPVTAQVLRAYLANTFYLDDPKRAPFENESLWGFETAWSVQQLLSATLKDAGITRPGVVPHSFRHTATTFLLSNGVPLAEVSQYMRHREPKTTMRYAHDLANAKTAEFLSLLVSGPVRIGPARTGNPARIF